MSVFDHLSYKDFVRQWVESRPKRGHGEYRRMAKHLRISSTMISQVFHGDKDLNLETASELCEYFGLSRAEEDYFFMLVEFARAGSHKLKSKLKIKIVEMQKVAQKIEERVVKNKELTIEQKAIYYSSWTYTGVRNLLAIPQPWSLPEIAGYLQISESQVRSVLQFLVDVGLLALADGKYEVLSKATHLGSGNPLVVKHHQNWRIRGLQKMDTQESSNLFYTGPMSLSLDDSEKVSRMILDFIQQVNKLVVESPSETARCLNFDWFKY